MLSRNLDKAREAYKNKDAEAVKEAHNEQAHFEPHKQGSGQYIGSAVYGGLDGIITTFAVVAGVAGAQLSAGVVLILGFANLFADGISMAVGDFLSTRAEQEYNASEKKRESWEVDVYPEGEKQELVDLYTGKGYSKEDAQQMVDIIAKNKEGWVDIMMKEELEIIEDNSSPLKNSLVTFVSFAVFGFIPLIAFTVAQLYQSLQESTFLIASIMTGATLFILGALKVRITNQKWYRAGAEMLLVGGIAAVAAYLVGVLLKGVA
ncbi:MAG: VIT1/CCC1 transporter family protein [Bacteroidota bacterium]